MNVDGNRAFALFNDGRYEEAVHIGSGALREEPRPTPAQSAKLEYVIRAAKLLQRLSVKGCSTSVTAELEAGWYSKRLRQLVDGGELSPLAATSVRMGETLRKGAKTPVISGFDSIATSGCAIVARIRDGALSPDRGHVVRRGFGRVLRGGLLDQWTDGVVYAKDGVEHFDCGRADRHKDSAVCWACDDLPLPMYRFPEWHVPAAAPVTCSGPLDVQYGTGLVPPDTHARLRRSLDRLARKRPDSPAPMYHNIIDPNVGAVRGLWVPTEIEAVGAGTSDAGAAPGGAAARIRSAIPDLPPRAHAALYAAVEAVFEAALPLLARVQSPALLLPGPVQAVVKAQRVVLRAGERYAGVWHSDGLREHVVAVVLYYYRVTGALRGGAVEFASARRGTLGAGENTEFPTFSDSGARGLLRDLPRCTVHVEEGTLLVFANFAAVHRVLPMTAEGAPGARDFLAFFVIDQRDPLPMPRELGPVAERKARREGLLREQLRPRGRFALSGEVYATGNGTHADVSWLAARKDPGSLHEFWEHEEFFRASALVSQMNMPPPVLGRGASFLIEYQGPSAVYNKESPWVLHIFDVDNDRGVFTNTVKWCCVPFPPAEGIREVKVFDNFEEWEALGFYAKIDLEMGREASFLGSKVVYNGESPWVLHIIGKENDRGLFMNMMDRRCERDPPKEGISAVKAFKTVDEWDALGSRSWQCS